MFKKRLVKKQGEKVTRKLELQDSDSSDSEVKILSNDTIKFKRQKFKHSSDVKTKSEKDEDIHKPVNKSPSNESSDSAVALSASVAALENLGPVKPLPQNIKTITITDFQPDVCKDFMQTGYCGYGDTCKFLHIRDESRQKNQINKDWETVTKKKDNNDKNDKKEAVPFKCLICKKDYSSPIRTECNHLFCQECFLNRFKVKKKTTCYVCGKETNGIFTPVPKKEFEKLLAA